VITAYGDDSVQQLAGMHLVVENASNLLTKKLEWGRLASYLEQSTRYIYYDKKDSSGRYRYYLPPYFKPTVAKRYKKDMDKIFDLYSELVHNLAKYLEQTSKTPKKDRDGAWKSAIRAQACDAARPVLPVATTSTVGIFASGQALESLILHLQSDRLKEANQTGDSILAESRKVLSTFLERSDKPDRGGAIVAYRATKEAAMRELTLKLLPTHHTTDQDPVSLTEYWPHNELDLVADMLYENSTLSIEEIRTEVAKWPYQQKVEVISAYMGERLNRRHRPGRALEKAHYSWDLVCDYGIFRDLQRHRMVDDLEWQQLTPRFGYEIPELVEQAGCTDLFEECFSISLGLYSFLQENKYDLEAQYATLLGHKMRWKFTLNAREAFHFIELRTSPQGHPGYRKLTKQLYDKVCEVHPLLGEAMKFVNKDEDPELSRLAAERYTQYKLKAIK
jgi:thymidylate synthase ThyX